VITYMGVIPWYYTPSSQAVCLSRVWISAMGYAILLATLFLRSWQLYRLYTKMVIDNNWSFQVMNLLEMGGAVAFVIILQAILLIIWTLWDPWTPEKVFSDNINNIFEWRCNCEFGYVWFGIEFIFFGCLCVWGTFVVYTAWDWHQIRMQTRWLLISVYNLILVLVIIALLSFQPNSDDRQFYIASIATCFSTTNVVAAICVPYLLEKLGFDSVSKGKSTPNTNTMEKMDKSERSERYDRDKVPVGPTIEPQRSSTTQDTDHDEAIISVELTETSSSSHINGDAPASWHGSDPVDPVE